MNPHAVREFVSRSWHDATSAKLAYWADLFRTNPGAVWESAQSLRAYVSNVRAGFPTSEERDADLRHHLLLRSRLDSAAHAFCRR